LDKEPASVGQQARDPHEQPAVDLLLPPGGVLLRGAEVLERAEASDGVERAEGGQRDLPCILDVDVEAVAPAGRRLHGGEGDAHPDAPSAG
jgi:hypothetical protein